MLNSIEKALLAAIEENDPEICQDLFTLFANHPKRYNIQSTNKDGQTALHLACLYAPTIVPLLAPFHLNINAQDKHGCTPLHYACCKGDAEVVTYLCEQAEAAPLELRDNAGKTPLTCAIEKGK
jgi:ankyrin repeat protein